MGKPIIMLPRYASRKKHTTDHQVHAVKWLRDKRGVHVAMSDDELAGAIDKAPSESNINIGEFRPSRPNRF
jgi:hypothetical protein